MQLLAVCPHTCTCRELPGPKCGEGTIKLSLLLQHVCGSCCSIPAVPCSVLSLSSPWEPPPSLCCGQLPSLAHVLGFLLQTPPWGAGPCPSCCQQRCLKPGAGCRLCSACVSSQAVTTELLPPAVCQDTSFSFWRFLGTLSKTA